MRFSKLIAATAGLLTVSTAIPALAQTSPAAASITASSSKVPPTPGQLTMDGKTADIYALYGGDMRAEVVEVEGQSPHLGPAQYLPFEIQTDARGLLALAASLDGLLSGKPVTTNATVLYGGRSLSLNGARLTAVSLPTCNKDKPASSRVTLQITFDAMKLSSAPPPAYVAPLTLTSCTILLDGLKSADIRTASNVGVRLPVKIKGIGELRTYDDEEIPSTSRNVGLVEPSDKQALSSWARDYAVLGIETKKSLQITYAGENGTVFTFKYGAVLPWRISPDLGKGVSVTVATEKPSLVKP